MLPLCFPPCKSLQFSFLLGRTHLSFFTPSISCSFFANIARSWVCWMIVSAFCTSNFFHAIFLYVVQVFFTAFGTCVSPSIGFSVVSTFFVFEALLGSWDVLLDSQDNSRFSPTGLVKCQDVSDGLDSFLAFSDGDSSYICSFLFSQGWCYHLFCSQCQFPTPDNSLGSVEFLMQVRSAFRWMKGFYF